MEPQVDTGTQEQIAAALSRWAAKQTERQAQDPIDQAVALIADLSAGERLNSYGRDQVLTGELLAAADADDRTLVLAAVGIAIAHHLSRLADAAEKHNNLAL